MTCCSRGIRQHNLPLEAFQWYLDVRKYGTFPHSGFGMGLERLVAWICGVPHLREAIPTRGRCTGSTLRSSWHDLRRTNG